MKKSEYKTKQKDILLNYIKSLNSEHFTVKQIYKNFKDNNQNIGMTTIYRHLNKLVKEGFVKKHVLDGETEAIFEYIGNLNHSEEHYHFKCEKCGMLRNFNCRSLDNIQGHLCEEHGFDINSIKTIFYGTCTECARNIK
ncbi:transcriptional repressor [Tissierella praeacuta]|uniref:Fur family transcriptional regulator n=1 Tax=Tissierella praeacuta TaxID=43131 RepID=UPI00333E6CC9